MDTVAGIGAALLSAFGWAFATVLIKAGMRSLSPSSANVLRLYTVSVFYAVTLAVTGGFGGIISAGPWRILMAFISSQFGFVVGDYFYFHALKRMGVSRTVPITSTYPLWTVVWAVTILGRSAGYRVYLGASLIVLAVVVVKRAEEAEHADLKGFIFALLAPLSWSMGIIIMDWLTPYFNPLTLSALRMFSATVGVSVFVPGSLGEIMRVTRREILIIAGAAFSGLYLGQILFVYATAEVGSQISAPVSAVNPILASGLAVVFLGEKPGRRILEGLALAVVGILLVSSG